VEARSGGGPWGDATRRDACVLDGVEETPPRRGVEEAAGAAECGAVTHERARGARSRATRLVTVTSRIQRVCGGGVRRATCGDRRVGNEVRVRE
jgi:hypothetical protein